MNRREMVTKVIKRLGINPNLKGYYCIREAVLLVAEDFSYINAMHKRLYPAVAEKLGTTTNIERAIRHAIDVGWKVADKEFAKTVFGEILASRKEKPTNTEFITSVADYVALMEE